jgi:recombinational DNA repair ATPase RecF
MSGDRAEDEVYRRAFEGFDHPVSYEGEITTTYKAYSDNLAMFFLKGLRPDRYRDNQAGITLQGPTQINITIKGDSSLPSTPQDLITCDSKKDK